MRATSIALISALATIGIVACSESGETSAEPMQAIDSAASTDAVVDPEVANAGPDVGEAIPANFTARNLQGRAMQLADLTGENGLVLVFNRSADWCGYCQAQMVSLRDIRADLEQRGYALATISYDAPDVLAEFAGRENIEYAMLSDEGSTMIDAFELRDPQYSEDSFAYGVPRPAIFVIAPDGTVQAKMVESDYRIRPENSDIVAAVDAL